MYSQTSAKDIPVRNISFSSCHSLDSTNLLLFVTFPSQRLTSREALKTEVSKTPTVPRFVLWPMSNSPEALHLCEPKTSPAKRGGTVHCRIDSWLQHRRLPRPDSARRFGAKRVHGGLLLPHVHRTASAMHQAGRQLATSSFAGLSS